MRNNNDEFFDDISEVRCVRCRKLLAKVRANNKYEIKFRKCGTLNIIFEQMKEQIIITDPKGIILYVNAAVENITGYSIEEIIGKKPSLWGKQMSEKFYRELWEKIKIKKRATTVRIINKKKTGEQYAAHLRISPILDTSKNVRFFVGIET